MAMADSAAAFLPGSNIAVLTTGNYKQWMATHSFSLVRFCHPYIDSCNKLAPEFIKAAATLKKEGIPCAQVDCTKEQPVCIEMGIFAYPGIRVIKNGKFTMYHGSQKEAELVRYVLKSRTPIPAVSADNFDHYTKSDRVVVIGFMDDKESAQFKELEAFANDNIDKYTFGVVEDEKLAKKYGVAMPGVAVFKQFEEDVDVLEGDLTVDNLRRSAMVSSVPILSDYSYEYRGMRYETGLPFGYILYDGAEMRSKLERVFYPIAKENKGALHFFLMSVTEFKEEVGNFELRQKWPAFLIQNRLYGTKEIFPQRNELVGESIRAFISDYKEGRLKRKYKSEPIPEADDGDAFAIVGDQFNEVVFDKTKDVLVDYYDPWCRVCKDLTPIYSRLGRALSKNKSLVIARMDVSKNDIPSEDHALVRSGFPTVLLVRAGDNQVARYMGDRKIESLVAFIENNAANKITYNEGDLEEPTPGEAEASDDGAAKHNEL
ncbi:protein disulfide-isomerase precursor [Dipsacomyces acuminosporus]|nr:protein disulfide-isomerase precursor [Dipsacomyces acuminosporus]